MVKKEEMIINNIKYIRSYSDEGYYISDGESEILYEDAIDLEELHKDYTETNIKIINEVQYA